MIGTPDSIRPTSILVALMQLGWYQLLQMPSHSIEMPSELLYGFLQMQ